MYYSNCQLLSKSFSMATIQSYRNVLENAQLLKIENMEHFITLQTKEIPRIAQF